MKLRIPFCYWGGEPICVINGTTADLKTLKKWGDFLSNPATSEQSWIDGLSQGRTWLDLPSADGKRRLLLRVFRHDKQGSRSLWFFVAFSIDIALAEPAIWAAAIRHLLVMTEKEISESNGCIELDRGDHTKNISSSPPLGSVYRGSYGSAFDRYCEALAGCQWPAINGLFAASHPPAPHPDFTTLIIADDFCYQGIRLITKSAPVTPESKPQKETQVTGRTSSPAWTHQILSRFKLPIVLAVAIFAIGFFLGRFQFRSILNSFEKENQVLRAQIRNLLFEHQKIESDNQTPRTQRQSDSPTTKGRQSVSPAGAPNLNSNP